MSPRFLLAVALSGALVAGAAAQEAPAPRVVGTPDVKAAPSAAALLDRQVLDEVKARGEVMANLRHLSDVIGPRLTGSKNLEVANKWAAERMKSYGLENVRLEPWEIPVGWERGPATMTLVEPNQGRSLLVAARGWTPGTRGKVTGEVVILEAKTKADLLKYRGKLKNAVVLRGPPATVAPVTDLTYGPKKDEPKKDEPKKDEPPRLSFAEVQALRREMDEFLKGEGVAVVVSDAGKPHGLLVTTGGWREGDRGTAQDPLPSLFLAHEHYALLYRLAGRAGVAAPRVEVEVSNAFVPGPVEVYNTVGEVRGSDKPDEVVVVGAHLDSWDLGTGTTDNGTGSTVVLEVARAVAKLAKEGHRPRRTIRFVLFAGEEQGLYGSKRYCERHKDELAKHSAALVHDTGTGPVLGFGLQGREAVRKVLEPELDGLKVLPGWKGLDLGSLNGTDHQSFEAAGVPGFACRQEMGEYRLTHHTQTDTFDKANEPNLIQGAGVIAVTALRVANLPELLPRDKPTPPAKK